MSRERIRDLVHSSKQWSIQAHPAKSDLKYESLQNDLYPTYLDEELAQLNSSTTTSTTDVANLRCLPYITTTDRVEQTIYQSKELILQLQKQEAQLKSELKQETKLHDELAALNELLEQRIDIIDTTISTKSPAKIIGDLESKNQQTAKRNKTMLSDLKRILEQHIAPQLKEKTTNEKELAADLKSTVENLLNAMFDSSSSLTDADSNRYVRVTNVNSPIVHFLLRGELVTTKPDDPRYIKLREFGKD